MSDGAGPARDGLRDVQTRPETQRAHCHAQKGTRGEIKQEVMIQRTGSDDSDRLSLCCQLRFYRPNQAVRDKASMLYNRFKNAFLVGEGEEVVSAAFLRSLLEEKEREEAQRAERCRERLTREELLQEVKRRMGQVRERRRTDGGEEEEKTEGKQQSSRDSREEESEK